MTVSNSTCFGTEVPFSGRLIEVMNTNPTRYLGTASTSLELFIIIITNFLHGFGRLTCSGIDALPSFPGRSTVSSSSRFVEGVFRESGVVHSFKVVIQFCLYVSLTSCIPAISSSFLMSSLLILSSLVYPVTLLTKRISAASRRVMSLFVVTHVSLPYSRLPTFAFIQSVIHVSLPYSQLPTFRCHTVGYPRFAAIQSVTHVSLPYSQLPTFRCHTVGYPCFAAIHSVTHVLLPYSQLPTFCCHTVGYPSFAAIQ